MTIHGQFNKGFIMASSGHELFIIDQHASDEKFNFERLQDQLVLNKYAATYHCVSDILECGAICQLPSSICVARVQGVMF